MKKFEGIRFLHFAHLSVVFTGSRSLKDLRRRQSRVKREKVLFSFACFVVDVKTLNLVISYCRYAEVHKHTC